MEMIKNPHAFFSFVDNINEADYVVKSKFRGINPLISLKSTCIHVTELDDELAKKYNELKQKINKDWLIKTR